MAEEEQLAKNEENTVEESVLHSNENSETPHSAAKTEISLAEVTEQIPGPNSMATPREDVCRDFMKNICNRGSRCKFYHPPQTKARFDEQINFCIDFQNRGCARANCRFVHCSRDEVEMYKINGEVTHSIARAIAAVYPGNTIAGIPLCLEFQSGKCLRGPSRCRYWHINVEEEKERRARRQSLPPPPAPVGRGYPPTHSFPSLLYRGGMSGMRRSAGPMDDIYGKRPRMEDQRFIELERRNAELMLEVENLRREIQLAQERHNNLLALFQEQQKAAVPPLIPTQPAPPQGYSATYAIPGWNPNFKS